MRSSIRAMRKLLFVVALSACGGSRPAPAPAPTTPEAPKTASAEPEREPEPNPKPAPSVTAPAIAPAKTYDATACKARVETMKQRLDAAYKFSEAAMSYRRSRFPIIGKPDADLTAAPISVSLTGTR